VKKTVLSDGVPRKEHAMKIDLNGIAQLLVGVAALLAALKQPKKD
jgi:hypothetical protein